MGNRYRIFAGFFILFLLFSAVPPGSPAEAKAVEQTSARVDIVFLMDTSGSMNDDFLALCSGIPGIISQLQAMGVTATYKILGIIQVRDCATSTVPKTLSSTTIDHEEDWGPGIRDLSVSYPWKAGAARLVIPMTDEGPQNGLPCDTADETAIQVASLAATANRVRVSPILSQGYDACIVPLATSIAKDTGGKVFYSTQPAKDLAQGIKDIIGAVASDKDGDGIADNQDPYPNDPCKPDRQAICLPRQVCGVSNTPRWDDDKDSRTDEELPNGRDDDSDGLIDEDVGGVNCPYPKQDCGVNNHRYFDDDGDNKSDEEIDNDKDDDRDSYIDEDISCACPTPQTTGKETFGIDDDHDFKTDEEIANNKDDDRDGCIDEDIGLLNIAGLLKPVPQTIQPNQPFQFNFSFDPSSPPPPDTRLQLAVFGPDKRKTELGTFTPGASIQPAGNFTISQPGIYTYGINVNGYGPLNYTLTAPGPAQKVDYEKIFKDAAERGGLPAGSVQVYPLNGMMVAQSSIYDLNFRFSTQGYLENLNEPVLTEDALLLTYLYQYEYPGDFTYVPPDNAKLERARAIRDKMVQEQTRQTMKYVSEGVTLLVYAKEAFVCATGVMGTAVSAGTTLVLCAPLVIHLTADGANALIEREYKKGNMDSETYNAMKGTTRITAAGLKWIVAPETALTDVAFASEFVAGTSQIVFTEQSDTTIAINAGADVVKLVNVAKTASEYASAYEVVVHSPVHLEVVDPRGRQITFDRENFQVKSTIPGATVSLPGMEPQKIWIPNPVSGEYRINLEGTGSGGYTLEIGASNQGQATQWKTFRGSITLGEQQDMKSVVTVDAKGGITAVDSNWVHGPAQGSSPWVYVGIGLLVFGLGGILLGLGIRRLNKAGTRAR